MLPQNHWPLLCMSTNQFRDVSGIHPQTKDVRGCMVITSESQVLAVIRHVNYSALEECSDVNMWI